MAAPDSATASAGEKEPEASASEGGPSAVQFAKDLPDFRRI